VDGGAEVWRSRDLAGVIVGFMIPLEEKHGKSPAKALEHVLHPWVAFMILPLFAFANAGVSLQGSPLPD
jgi:NhaA family Na+:H+ antiporter